MRAVRIGALENAQRVASVGQGLTTTLSGCRLESPNILRSPRPVWRLFCALPSMGQASGIRKDPDGRRPLGAPASPRLKCGEILKPYGGHHDRYRSLLP